MTNEAPMAGLHIRPATIADLDSLLAVWKAAGLGIKPQGRDRRDRLEVQIRVPDSYLLAWDGKDAVGAVLATHDGRKGWINRLAVIPSHRRRGIGQLLVRAAETVLERQGIEIICALVEEGNTPSYGVFSSLAYAADVPVRYFRKLIHPEA